jgi:hypothetical protein
MKKCEWEYQGDNEWKSGCGHSTINWNECEGPHEDDQFNFCPYCGGEIECKPTPCEQCANWLKDEKDCFYVNITHSPRCDDFKEQKSTEGSNHEGS